MEYVHDKVFDWMLPVEHRGKKETLALPQKRKRKDSGKTGDEERIMNMNFNYHIKTYQTASNQNSEIA